MNMFGIALTPGHLIIGAALVIIYDALWTWAFSNKASAWWFERLQGLLKAGIYTGFMALVLLIAYTPWPVNLILAVSTGMSIGFFIGWLRKHNKKETKEGSKK